MKDSTNPKRELQLPLLSSTNKEESSNLVERLSS